MGLPDVFVALPLKLAVSAQQRPNHIRCSFRLLMAMYLKKNLSPSAVHLSACDLAAIDARDMHRRISNRDSARRTRQRRNREMAVLREKNEELQAGAEALRAQVADLEDANSALQASIPSDQTVQCAAFPLHPLGFWTDPPGQSVVLQRSVA